ncbi:histidine kinase/DNA gyrase B/HSP90-like ATPase [Hydrogenispora ethanolica]|uniref:histidine kinase n=1 Tax=Hydrogenispora ethanolica TaxID=1082276 RepID=A0A4R1RIZ2_HYDET|nr:histidine kinase [Hydrogenispora ethanolica]TCL65969.1 histidine kinase/DNA gyrase B/HSP90-like ATPase [Hydrogenispora ethanolica]
MATKQPAFQTIRSKLLIAFLLMLATFALVSFISYYSERFLLNRVNVLLTHNLKLKEFRADVDNVVICLEKYLISRNFNNLRDYYRYSQAVDGEYANLGVIKPTLDNFLLLENIRNMTRSFLEQGEAAVQAKRARDSSGYHHAFLEVSRYRTNINWAIDRLITQQLEENSRQYLLISKRLTDIQRLGQVLIAGALLFSVIMTIWISYRLTKPLRKLVEAARTITRGKFTLPPLDVSSNDEVAVVAGTFNDMASSLDRLIREMKNQSELEKRLQEQELQNLSMKNTVREAELHALQSQINPHFLFNMLNAGVQLAVLENAEQTADYVDKVSSLLRYNLRRLDVPVSIAEEANHLRTYFFILRTRYGDDRFQFEVSIPEAVADVQIPLLTLQPIVENALIHGIEELESGGRITVRAWMEQEQAVIEVADNGRGIDESTLELLQQNKSRPPGHTTGLGLQNVKERLRIFFGADDLMRIESVSGRGTTVTLRLPARSGGESEVA